MNTTNQNETDAPKSAPGALPPAAHFYRAVWRWHFYAGLFVVPFMVMLSLTGIIYLFKPQLDWLMYRERMYVAPEQRSALVAAQLAAVRQAYPGAQVSAFRLPPHPDRSAEAEVATADGRNLTVFINPYSAKVLGEMDSEWNLQEIAVKLHGELMIGRPGDWLIELATCWGLVLLVSGLYMWWPRSGSRLWGVWLPRMKRNNPRVFWRDLHSVFGMYGALVVGFLLFTGLPWAGFWGTNFARIWGSYPVQQSPEGFKSDLRTGSLNQTADKLVPWAVEQMPMPQSNLAGGHEHHAAPASFTPMQKTSATPLDLDAIAAVAREKGVREGFRIALPLGADGVYTVSAPTDDPLKQATLHLDQYSGKVLADVRWRDYGLVPKATEMGIALHEGVYFGLANQLLMLFGALVVILLAVSGAIMWWQRRPARTLGAPAMPPNFPLWKGAVAIICVMGLLFPFVGISLLFVLLLDSLVLSRVPRMKAFWG